jgi:hypothetical protein
MELATYRQNSDTRDLADCRGEKEVVMFDGSENSSARKSKKGRAIDRDKRIGCF